MTTLEKVKDQVAQRMGFGNWKRFVNFVKPTDEIVDEVAKLYANAKLEEAAEVSQAYLGVNDEPLVAKGTILKLKDQI